jgi:hypothetical protein
MKTDTSPAQANVAPTAVATASVRQQEPARLTERELEMVAAAGGRGGIGGEIRCAR